VVLAIAGNVLKAFPGAGTVTGGLVHAGIALGIVLSLQSTVLQRRDVNALAGVAFGGLTLLTWSLALRGD
jgi:hypothetical protein